MAADAGSSGVAPLRGALASAPGEVHTTVELPVPQAGAAAVSPPPHARAPWLRSWLRRVPVDRLRAPAQMFVALACGAALATSPHSAAAFDHHGSWVAVTVSLALEANVGATQRKASLRAVGTLAGGLLAALCVAATAILNGGWPPGAPPGKVAAMTLLVASAGSAVQAVRARDPSHDYAYAVVLVTLSVASLSNFAAVSWRAALKSVGWRIATIATGGVLAATVSAVIVPQCALANARLRLPADSELMRVCRCAQMRRTRCAARWPGC